MPAESNNLIKYNIHLMGSFDKREVYAQTPYLAAIAFGNIISLPNDGWIVVDGDSTNVFKIIDTRIIYNSNTTQQNEAIDSEKKPHRPIFTFVVIIAVCIVGLLTGSFRSVDWQGVLAAGVAGGIVSGIIFGVRLIDWKIKQRKSSK